MKTPSGTESSKGRIVGKCALCSSASTTAAGEAGTALVRGAGEKADTIKAPRASSMCQPRADPMFGSTDPVDAAKEIPDAAHVDNDVSAAASTADGAPQGLPEIQGHTESASCSPEGQAAGGEKSLVRGTGPTPRLESLSNVATERQLQTGHVGAPDTNDGTNQLAVLPGLAGTDGPILLGPRLAIPSWRSPPTFDQYVAYQNSLPRGLCDEGWEDESSSFSACSRAPHD